jgi:hypothetical protein
MLLAVGLTIATAARADDNQDVLAKLAQGALLGCWEHERLGVSPSSQGKEVRIGSHLMCFNHKGVMSGVTFDAGDGWDWNNMYRLEDSRIIVYAYYWDSAKYEWKARYNIKQIDKTSMDVEIGSEHLRYSLLCHTVQENIQCERMKEEPEQPSTDGSK